MKKFLYGFVYAIRGLIAAMRSGRNLRLHFMAAAIVIVCGFYVHISMIEWVILVLCIGVVITAELVNTAIEQIVDLVSPEENPRAGKIKDIAAGAVLISALIAAVAGGIIFIPKLI